MASKPARAIATALGIDPDVIVGWSNDPTTGQLILALDGASTSPGDPFGSENITVLGVNVHAA